MRVGQRGVRLMPTWLPSAQQHCSSPLSTPPLQPQCLHCWPHCCTGCTHLSRSSSSSSPMRRLFIHGSTRARVAADAVAHTARGGSGYSSWSRSVPATRSGGSEGREARWWVGHSKEGWRG